MPEQTNEIDTQKSAQEALSAAPDVPAISVAPKPAPTAHPGNPNAAPVKFTMRVEPAPGQKADKQVEHLDPHPRPTTQPPPVQQAQPAAQQAQPQPQVPQQAPDKK